MKRFLILYMAAILILPIAANARKKTEEQQPLIRPLVVIFGAPMSEKLVGDSDVISENVLVQLAMSGRFQMMKFNAGLPVIARAVMENRLPGNIAEKVGDPAVGMQIAKMSGASYTLRIMGSVVPNPNTGPTARKVVINLDLVKVVGGKWTYRAESEVAQEVGVGDDVKLDLAASTCASATVSGLLIQAFGNDPSFLDSSPKPVASSLDAIVTNVQPERNIDEEYAQAMSQAEAYLSANDASNAIVALKAAINLRPAQVEPRKKLAGAYIGIGMTASARDEYKRALQFNRDNTELHSLLVKLSFTSGSLSDAADECREIIRLNPKDSAARLSLGDIFWNQGKLDDAEAAYKDAASVDTVSSTPHDRLRTLYLARKNYARAIVELQQSKALVPGSHVDPLVGAVCEEFDQILRRLDSGASDYEKRRMSHEDYYQDCKDLQIRIESFDKYLSGVHVTDAFKDAYSHAAYAVSLAEQSNSSMITSLENGNQSYADQATLLRDEARTEFGLYTSGLPK